MDIRLSLDERGADLEIENGDLAVDPGLGTALLLSLFTDAEAQEDERVPGHRDPQDLAPPGTIGPRRDRRGWWSDPSFGSKLWLVRRGKLTAALAEQARLWAEESLAWLVQRGIAEKATADVSIAEGRLDLEVRVVRGSADRYEELWQGEASGLSLSSEGLTLRILYG